MALSDDRITALGDELFTALRTRSVLSPLTARETDIDIDDAYRISLRFLERRTADGETLIGKKIGVTSKPVQDMLGVHQPDFGFLTDRMQVANGEVVSIAGSGLIQPRAEGEIAFVLADAVYGSDHRFRRMLEDREQPYVLAVRSTHSLRFLEEWHLVQTDPATMIADLPPEAWHPLNAGEGAKGPRLYDWAWVPLSHTAREGFSRWLLARRNLRDPEAIAYYFAYAGTEATLADLAAAAGLRWTIEECFLRAKEDLGLDHCEARSWHGWHRHMSLVMAASAFLARLSADQRRTAFSKPNKTSPQIQTAAA